MTNEEHNALNLLIGKSKIYVVRYTQKAKPYEGKKTLDAIQDWLRKDKPFGLKKTAFVAANYEVDGIRCSIIFKKENLTDGDEICDL
jgi:hypothetical protein